MRRAARERMANIRRGQSEQKREAEKAKDAVRKSASRKNQSGEQIAAENAKSAVRMSISRKNQSGQNDRPKRRRML